MNFPEGFYFGAATSSHQVEGGNHNDWSEWEKANAERLAREAVHSKHKHAWGNLPEYLLNTYPNPRSPQNYISGRASDHYHLFEEDIETAKQLGHNAYRFSIEWSRIEPQEGKFDEQEINHYRAVIRAVRARHMEPFVTLWHWTIPLWLRDKGGVASRNFPKYFARYAERMAKEFKGEVRFWMTLNEPQSVIGNSYMTGIWPPQKKGPISALQAYNRLAETHIEGFKAIRRADTQAKIGLAHAVTYDEPYRNNFLDRLTVNLRSYFNRRRFIALTRGYYDWVGIQYYFHNRISFPGRSHNENKVVSDMGWELYPEGIYHLVREFRKMGVPMYITESGLADSRDTHRADYIRNTLNWIHKAIREGADVRGYFHWSLLDNFEWSNGFWPRFGLIEVDYKTLERKVRPSALIYKEIIQNAHK